MVKHILFDDGDIQEVENAHFSNTLPTFNKLFSEPVYFIFNTRGADKLVFDRVESDIFKRNLILIDSCLPILLSEVVLEQYRSASGFSLSELILELTKNNPLNFNLSYGHPFYRFKIMNFLCAILYGMEVDRLWDGEYAHVAGFNLISNKGDMTCCYVYNLYHFQCHLITRTKLATQVVVQDDRLIKLGLQMEFI